MTGVYISIFPLGSPTAGPMIDVLGLRSQGSGAGSKRRYQLASRSAMAFLLSTRNGSWGTVKYLQVPALMPLTVRKQRFGGLWNNSTRYILPEGQLTALSCL